MSIVTTTCDTHIPFAIDVADSTMLGLLDTEKLTVVFSRRLKNIFGHTLRIDKSHKCLWFMR